ncbi:hypothetical protein RHSIM_RhsimUnG0031900 [Rhododendron simsii]|uniref:Auxin-responsive protein n=1 Tax=Rhododendron simsii TaxID=118357 RepID=A0A834FWZ9_RHOSS|nr:hypothetical protein RHSIM_RhsimUnG0031900 [Rhododendron simsii]
MAEPIPSFRKKAMAMVATNLTKKSDDDGKSGSGCLYVKVSMDGAPYLRKVDLKTYSNYIELSSAIEEMFSCFTIGQCSSHGLSESHSKDLLHGSEQMLAYEDKDGDWLLVGDVPWEMFIDSCKSIRIMKGPEEIGQETPFWEMDVYSSADHHQHHHHSSNSIQVSEEEEMMELRRGPWTDEEDYTLMNYIAKNGEGRWNSLARCAGLKRTGKSCRLRWLNYLRPDVRRGNITLEEQLLILELHSRWGNRWSKIAQHLPGRTDNEIKNYWRTRVQKHAKQLIWLDELEETPSDPRVVEELNCDPMEVPPIISRHFSILQVLDLSYTEINSLPQSISKLVALRKLFLRGCELLMELPPEIGELVNLEVLDLEGTEILCLPKEIAKLVNLTCLKVSFYGYANQRVIPRRVLSNLSCLKELIIDVTPYGEWWDVEVETIIDDMRSLKELTTLKLSLPTAELLRNLAIFRRLSNFRFTVGRHGEHFVSRIPHDVEEEFNNREKLDKGLKYINGSRLPNEVTEVFRNANAFFLQRHWTANSLSEFGHENMNEVKFCLVMECSEFRTVIDSEQFHQGKDGMSESEDFQDFDEAIVLGSLEKLIIRYVKNMESVWKGPVGKGSLSNLKSLALHTCPNLTTLFTIDMFRNLLNLEELIVEDCRKIDSLVSLKSSDSESGLFLPNLKNISLLELPELVSISSGLCIAPNLERIVIFYCPKLEKLSTMDVSSTKLKVIKGEKEWWDTLKWYESDLSTEHEDYLARLFVPLRRDGDLMAQLTKD